MFYTDLFKLAYFKLQLEMDSDNSAVDRTLCNWVFDSGIHLATETVLKTFITFVSYEWGLQAGVFVPGVPLQPSLRQHPSP